MAKFVFALFIGIVAASVSPAVTPNTNSKSLADAGKQPAKNANAQRTKQTVKISAELERKATSLVSAHLPELAPVLEKLKKSNPKQYELAIRDLAKSVRRLETAKTRDQELFEIEVEILKTQSDTRLLAAKLKVRDKKSDRDALRRAVERLHGAELQKQRYNIRETKKRLARTQQQLAAAEKRLKTLEDSRESYLEKNYQSLLKTAGRTDQPKSTPNKKPQ